MTKQVDVWLTRDEEEGSHASVLWSGSQPEHREGAYYPSAMAKVEDMYAEELTQLFYLRPGQIVQLVAKPVRKIRKGK